MRIVDWLWLLVKILYALWKSNFGFWLDNWISFSGDTEVTSIKRLCISSRDLIFISHSSINQFSKRFKIYLCERKNFNEGSCIKGGLIEFGSWKVLWYDPYKRSFCNFGFKIFVFENQFAPPPPSLLSTIIFFHKALDETDQDLQLHLQLQNLASVEGTHWASQNYLKQPKTTTLRKSQRQNKLLKIWLWYSVLCAIGSIRNQFIWANHLSGSNFLF